VGSHRQRRWFFPKRRFPLAAAPFRAEHTATLHFSPQKRPFSKRLAKGTALAEAGASETLGEEIPQSHFGGEEQ
jgi:hypothetical protein